VSLAPGTRDAATGGVFLAERYVPALSPRSVEQLTHRVATAADELRREGAEVHLVGSAALPGDETLLFLLAAPSAEVAALAVERADLAADRVVPALWQAGGGGC
jgi:hypothetical protein